MSEYEMVIHRNGDIPGDLLSFFNNYIGGRTAGYWLARDHWAFPFITKKDLTDGDISRLDDVVRGILEG